MATYSHSRLNTFETCPLQYKYRYIDRIKPDIDTSVEAFMGSRVHEALEELYRRAKCCRIMTLNQLIIFYRKQWRKNWTDNVKIVKENLTKQNYRRMGEKFLEDYYTRFKPFNEMKIIGLETQDRLTLPDGNQYHVRIDKLGCKGSTYFVCDYKTNAGMKDQSSADADRQLAMYSIWVKNKFSDAKKVVLRWHMLAFDKEVESVRSDKSLVQLQNEIMKSIKKIESATEFKPNKTALCKWCGYQSICPHWKHLHKVKELEPEEFKKEDGVKLVNELVKLEELKKDTVAKIERIKEQLIMYAKQLNVDLVFGSDHKATIKESKSLKVPAKNSKERVALETLIQTYNKWMEVSTLDSYAIKRIIKQDSWSKDLIAKARKLLKEETTQQVRIGKFKDGN
jgi:putative RecB family exonuclease